MSAQLPWRARKETVAIIAGVVDAKGRLVADVYGDGVAEREETARRLAAAPELLAALEGILAEATARNPRNGKISKHICAPELRQMIKEKAKAAIKKATKEGPE